MDGMAKLFNLQEGMQVTCSALVVLVTAVFFLSRRRSNKGNLAGKDHAKGKDAEDLVVEEDYAAEAEDVVTELDIPPETRGTFSLVEKSLQKKKGRDPTASMITHPEGQDVGPDLRIKTSKSPGKGTDMSENQKISMALEAGETVIKKGLVVKKKYKGLLPSVRVLILTDGVRLLMMDNQTFKVKGTVDLPPESNPEVELLEPKKFVVRTRDPQTNWLKETVLYSERASSWVREIGKTLQH